MLDKEFHTLELVKGAFRIFKIGKKYPTRRNYRQERISIAPCIHYKIGNFRLIWMMKDFFHISNMLQS